METLVLRVKGMSCEGCASRIERVLHRVDGVRGVVADHVCGRVEIRLSPELVDRSVLAERIGAAGYEVVEEASR
ncbi:copper chaperone CopZ [Spinactinospora alkalitolerans]|uniref:Copper chaperone CopZ n=1 Tax=Spinactinospora alkalitolerans TaxID=687207 RepID=A0A852TPQ8_9ACTN|nr:heavy-metal-associated domain-containing protein [Spinactinospora alkalitolerans]NYE45471.1 copper chaperone CopZ [Spinactinospora alkalitolerans]